MYWFLKVLRIAGSAFPVTAPLVQIQAEMDSDALKRRIRKFEDPISQLHNDVPKVSKAIYGELTARDSVNLVFDDDFYEHYGRVLAVLEAQGFISIRRAMGRKVPLGVNLTEPSYIVYMCAQSEDQKRMSDLVNMLEDCGVDQTLNAEVLTSSLGLAKYVIRALFQIYAARGLGCCSGGIQQFRYTGKA